MDFNSLKTLTGLTLAQLVEKLDEQLPADAYSAVPGGANLTDIDPNWMRKVLNRSYGLCGIGWGYAYASEDLTTEVQERKTKNGPRLVFIATLKRLRFWYKLIDGNGADYRQEIDASGGSENSSEAYAMKGAITNALGNAASNIGFQESVYLGKRSHHTVRQSGKKPAAPVQKTVAKTSAASAAVQQSALATPPVPAPRQAAKPVPAADDSANYVIPVGTRAGQTLAQVWSSDPKGQDAIAFYAGMATGSSQQKETLKKMAAAFLSKVKANGHEPVSTGSTRSVAA